MLVDIALDARLLMRGRIGALDDILFDGALADRMTLRGLDGALGGVLNEVALDRSVASEIKNGCSVRYETLCLT